MCYLCDIVQQATSNKNLLCNLTKNRNTSCVMIIVLKVAIIGSLAQSAPLYFLAMPVRDGTLSISL